MGKIIVFTNVSLDGVMQAPGSAEEDTRGGFKYGGWGVPYNAMVDAKLSSMSNIGAHLWGRRTYQDFYKVWADRTDNPFTEMLTNTQKFVASTTLVEPLPWVNSTLLKGDVAQALTNLKGQLDKDFLVMGSGVLVRYLMQNQLVDLYVLLVHPLILGSGQRLLAEGSPYAALKLVEFQTTPSGVAVLTYSP
jgi:dihydrofolate reductase